MIRSTSTKKKNHETGKMRPPEEEIKIKINEGEQYDISLVAQVEHYQAYLPLVAKGKNMKESNMTSPT